MVCSILISAASALETAARMYFMLVSVSQNLYSPASFANGGKDASERRQPQWQESLPQQTAHKPNHTCLLYTSQPVESFPPWSTTVYRLSPLPSFSLRPFCCARSFPWPSAARCQRLERSASPLSLIHISPLADRAGGTRGGRYFSRRRKSAGGKKEWR